MRSGAKMATTANVDVQRFSPEVEQAALEIIAAGVPYMDPNSCFGKKLATSATTPSPWQ
jgi:hypothetical protein